MLAAATMELRLVIPTWGDALLMAVGSGYLVVGGRWPRLFDVFSMTVIGCVVGLVVGNWVPLHPAIVISAAGIVVGGLAALFRNVGHAVLTGIVLAAAFSVLAAMAVGADGFASYLVTDVSAKSYAMRIYAPNLANDAVLAGAGGPADRGGDRRPAVLLQRPAGDERKGAALVLLGATQLIGQYRGGDQPPLAEVYPLTLAASWMCLVAIGLAAQAGMAEWTARREAAAQIPEEDDDMLEA